MSEQHYIERYWRDAVPADAIKEPPMVARFRNDSGVAWEIDELFFWDRIANLWVGDNYCAYDFCQVYDAPDSGEGWRLVDVEKETPKEGDQYLVHPDQWKDRGDCHGCFNADKFYRRRIEQPKPKPRYKPFRWEDREQLRGRWITYKHEDGTRIETQISHLSEHRLEGLWFKSRNSKWLLQNATFLDTGEPVGRRVQ